MLQLGVGKDELGFLVDFAFLAVFFDGSEREIDPFLRFVPIKSCSNKSLSFLLCLHRKSLGPRRPFSLFCCGGPISWTC